MEDEKKTTSTEEKEKETTTQPEGKETKPEETKEKEEKSFTQEQVNKMMAKEKSQGRNSVYKELGIDPKDSKAIEKLKALFDSQKTDEQREAEKASEEQEKLLEAEQRAQMAEIKVEAMMLGVKSQYVEDVVILALSKMNEETNLKDIIGEFKTKYPVWFEVDDTEDPGKKKGQKGTGSSLKHTKEAENQEKSLGMRLAAQRKSQNKKSTYWT